jgi:hypothetical protein
LLLVLASLLLLAAAACFVLLSRVLARLLLRAQMPPGVRMLALWLPC